MAALYNAGYAITKSDTVNYPQVLTLGPAAAIYVGTKGSTGTLVLITPDGSAVTLKGLTAGTIVPIASIRVNDTTTDTSDMVALYQV